MAAARSPPEKAIKATNRHHMPPEIIEIILSNLPVKHLINFRRVSKSWKSTISDPKFIRKHIARAAGSDTLPHKRLFMNHYSMKFHLERAFSCPVSSVSSLPVKETVNLSCPFLNDPYSRVELRAFCDELWCVGVNKSLFLWNPSMKSYRKIPNKPVRICSKEAHLCYAEAVYGLGYDSIEDDYKLLRVPCLHEDHGNGDLYSMRSDSWREIPRFPGTIKRCRSGQFVNGTLHWMVEFRNNQTVSSVITSFHLSTEKYGRIRLPDYSGDGYVDVCVLRGMLCVFSNNDDNALVVWAMKEYGVEESWCKIFDISFGGASSLRTEVVSLRGPWKVLIPVYLYENGEILIRGLVDDEWMIILHTNDRIMVDNIVARARGHGTIWDGFVYVESLVVLPGCNASVAKSNEHWVYRWKKLMSSEKYLPV